MTEHPDQADDARQPHGSDPGPAEQPRWYTPSGPPRGRPPQGAYGPQEPGPGERPANDPTTPLWYGNTGQRGAWGDQPGHPAYGPSGPSGPDGPTGGGGGNGKGGGPGGRGRWLAVPVAAVLAAALASGATYAWTHNDNDDAVAPATTQTQTQGSQQSSAPVSDAADSSPDWTAVAHAVTPSVVAITVTNGQSGDQGSGVILDTKGRIVTNNHVVASAAHGASMRVTLNDGRTYGAHVVGTDSLTDLAVIQIDNPPDGLTPIHLAGDNSLSVGQPVMAIGNPLGLAGTVTTGIVSALDRPVTTQQEGNNNPFTNSQADPVVTNAVQTSAAINPGNSGGALVDASGSLVGINSAIATVGQSATGGQSGNIGIGFAIPVSEVKSITSQLIKSGHAEHAWMGVYLKDARVQVGSASRDAAGVARVVPGSPADKAGLDKGDAIIAIDGEPVNSALSLVAQVHERRVGGKATVTVVRDGNRREVAITFGTNPNSGR